jgi:crotonobetainyl-CoA:carnitine CoA-transferase CaiB-like acyl-CoA transferase
MVELSAGIAAALGLVSGVLRARVTGVGGDVDTSLFDTATSLLTYIGAWHLTSGYKPQRTKDSSHPSQVPSQVLPTSDGWLVVMCAKEKFYRRLVVELGRPELADDPRFIDFTARMQNRDVLVPMLKELTLQRTTEEWLAVLRNKVPCAPVNTVEEALKDPQVTDTGMIISLPHDDFGTVHQMASPIRATGRPVIHVRAPRHGQHTAEVMDWLTTEPQRPSRSGDAEAAIGTRPAGSLDTPTLDQEKGT